MNSLHASALSAEQAHFLEDLYESYLKAPQSVSNQWQDFFRDLETSDLSTRGASSYGLLEGGSGTQNTIDISLLKEMGVQNLLNSYRSRGHLAANLDPLGIRKVDRTTIEDRLQTLHQKISKQNLIPKFPA